MDLGLRDKVVILTGGSRGIGRATALAFAAEGAHVAFCARTQGPLDQTVRALQQYGTRVVGQVADVTDVQALEQFLHASAQTLGGIDILVNNVGGSQGKNLATSTDEDWVRTFDLNLFHAVRTSRVAVPYMQQQGGGSIVTISSISGVKPSPSLLYGSAKAAEIFFGSALALELGPSRIRVNTVCPGSVWFPEGGWERTKQRDPARFAQFEQEEFPLGRLGTPQEIARVVVFVASPAGSWINGALIPVDGAQQQPSLFQKGPLWK